MRRDRTRGPRIEVRVDHDRIHARDCEECAAETREAGGKVDRFTRTISVEGDRDAALDTKIVEIANKCPVHRTLERGASVATELASDG